MIDNNANDINQFETLAAQYERLNALFSSPEDTAISVAAIQAAASYGPMEADHKEDNSIGLDLGLGQTKSPQNSFSDISQVSSQHNDSNPPSHDHIIDDPSSVLCLVLGEGGTPKTALLSAVSRGWLVVAIDEDLGSEWQGEGNTGLEDIMKPGKYLGFQGSMKEFLVNGREWMQTALCEVLEIRHIVIIGIESPMNPTPLQSIGGFFGVSDLREFYNRAPATIISISSEKNNLTVSDHKRPFNSAPKYSFVDRTIKSSPRRQVHVWNFPSSRTSSSSSSRASTCKRISSGDCMPLSSRSPSTSSLGRLSGKSGSDRTDLDSRSSANGRGRNSKVHQLQVQEMLAAENKRCSRSVNTALDQKLIEETKEKTHSKPRRSLLSIMKRKSTSKPAQTIDLPFSKHPTSQAKEVNQLEEVATPIITNSKKTLPPKSIDILMTSPPTIKRAQPHIICLSALNITHTSSSSDKDDTQSCSDASLKSYSTNTTTTSSSSTSSRDYHPGDIVEVRIEDIYQVGMIEKQSFKGVYDVKLFEDTPAWNKLRRKVTLYEDYYSHGKMILPEVPARHLRPFRHAEVGEVLYVGVDGKPHQLQIQGFQIDGDARGDEVRKLENMKYIVQFEDEKGSGWREMKHKVDVPRTYRQLFDI